MEGRQARGLEIVKGGRIRQTSGGWIVPSQTRSGKYAVRVADEKPTCTCPNHELHGGKCKHIFAVEFMTKREYHADGSTTIIETVRVTETVRRTYPQRWAEYNAAQTTEKDHFQVLLRDLCQGIVEPTPEKKNGRPRLPLADVVFAAAFKVYSTMSGRRFMSDLREAQRRGHVTKAPHYNSIFDYLESPALTPLLRQLVEQSSLPLKGVETDFAVDSSGFATSRFVKWYDKKYGETKEMAEWVKVHIMCGVRTNVVTAVEIRGKDANDSPLLPPLVDAAAKNFAMSEVSADKGYASHKNHDAIARHGATPFISFRSTATGAGGGTWSKAYGFFMYRREEWLARYHKRSNVESTFSMVKRKVGDAIRSRTDTAMVNEVLLKLICHNVVCVIHEIHELGIDPAFWATTNS